MLQNVLHDTMVDHAPFLISSIKDFSDNVPAGSDSIYVTEMAGSAGGLLFVSSRSILCNSPVQLCHITSCVVFIYLVVFMSSYL